MPHVQCEICSKDIYRSPKKMGKRITCSYACRNKAYAGLDSFAWKGGPAATKKRNINREYEQRRTQMYKRKAVDYLGGKCQVCGYRHCLAALDFHHLDPALKDKGIKELCKGKWERIVKELDKCVLLCSNCHREHHWRERHESGTYTAPFYGLPGYLY